MARKHMEHRCGDRAELRLPAVIHTPFARPVECLVSNIGCGGAFLQVPAPRRPRGLVRIVATLPGARPSLREWRAFVVHSQPDGIGVMFDQPDFGGVLPLLRYEYQATRRNATAAA